MGKLDLISVCNHRSELQVECTRQLTSNAEVLLCCLAATLMRSVEIQYAVCVCVCV